MPSRTPEAVLTALQMDPNRMELYVEGERDRSFLSWILGKSMIENMCIVSMKFVEISESVTGGERGRMFHFADKVPTEQKQIRFFADADFDKLLCRSKHNLIWLTDFRDLEGYLLSVDCIDRALRLGLANENHNADNVLEQINRHGRKLGMLRILSEKEEMHLPFQKTNLRKSLVWNGDELELQFDKYLQTLLQNANISLARFCEVNRSLNELTLEFQNTPDCQIVHGKDAICIFQTLLEKSEKIKSDHEGLLWCSFERDTVINYQVLSEVVNNLQNGFV